MHYASTHIARLVTITATMWCIVLLVGCRNDASQRDAYLRDLRMHEDQIYELQDYMTEYQYLLRQQRIENAKLRKQLSEASEAETELIEDDLEERSLLDRALQNEEREDALPDIELGEPDLPEIEMMDPDAAAEPIPAGEPEELTEHGDQQTMQLTSATNGERFEPLPEPTEIATSCAIYAEQTALESGAASDDAPIGLIAIVEPLTGEGSAGYFTGKVSLMLVDPLAEDEEWEISRWDFTPEEVEVAWRDTSRRVLDLPLAAPAGTPIGRPLELWVRLVPTEGERKILCSTAVTLRDPIGLIGLSVSGGESPTDPSATVSSRWTSSTRMGEDRAEDEARGQTGWHTATIEPPAAVAKATSRATPPPTRTAKRAPDWSPFR